MELTYFKIFSLTGKFDPGTTFLFETKYFTRTTCYKLTFLPWLAESEAVAVSENGRGHHSHHHETSAP